LTILNDFSGGFKGNLHDIVDSVTVVKGEAKDFATTKRVILARALYANESWIRDGERLSVGVTRLRELESQPKVDLRTGLARFIDSIKSSYLGRWDAH
jgi:hypothetical protein